MSGRVGIALLVMVTALFTASSAVADPVNTSPPELSVSGGAAPTAGMPAAGMPTAGVSSVVTTSPGGWASNGEVYGHTYQWQRCSYSNAVVDQAPMVYYRLDEPSGATAADSSGMGFDGTYSGLVSRGVSGALSTDGDTGSLFFGRALGGTQGQVGLVAATVDGGLPSGSDPITVEAWVKPASSFYGNFEPIVSFGDLNVGTWGFGLQPVSSSSASLALDGSGEVAASAPTLLPNTWHFLAATDDGSTQQLYIDGVPAGSFSSTTTKPDSTSLYVSYEPTPRVVIGGWSRPGGEYFNGRIDEVAVYDSILGASDIAGQYAAATDPESGVGCEDIVGATSPTRVVGIDDTGSSLRAQVSAWDDTGTAYATTSALAIAGTAPVWAPAPAPQTNGPLIDSGTLTDAAGAPIAGARVTLYPNLDTHTVVRPAPLATTTTDASGNYQIILQNSGQVAQLNGSGTFDMTRLFTTPSGIAASFFTRTFQGGRWTDEHGDLIARRTFAWEPRIPLYLPGRVPNGVLPGVGCRPITKAIGEADAYAPVGEIHLFADDHGWFTYGQDNFADTTFGVGVSSDGVNFSAGGSTHVGNAARVGWGTVDAPLQPYFSHVLLTKFHFEKTLTRTCFVSQYKVAATQWETGALVGRATSGDDGRCNLYPAGQSVVYGPNTFLERDRGRAYTYDGAVSVLGASLSAKSGYSSNVVLTMDFGSGLPTHWVCGDNGSPDSSARVFAGP